MSKRNSFNRPFRRRGAASLAVLKAGSDVDKHLYNKPDFEKLAAWILGNENHEIRRRMEI